ncbi:hypothetical protein JHK87_011190 [Glycine soja]|nr:hypothetical protein JHK87_011190 [Glycine soja]
MGWLGVVFKADTSRVSEHLAIGPTTGYLGSLTTFSGWNQKMVELIATRHWLLFVLGFLIGLLLVGSSITFGVETAKGFKWFLRWLNMRPGSGTFISKVNWKVDIFLRHLVVTIVYVVILGLLWGVAGALEKVEFKHGGGRLKWLQFGTLIADVYASWVVAALAIVKKSVNTKNCDTIATGIQFGLLGNLSTVSTFAAEFNAMRRSKHPWRAYAHAMITICISFSFGIFIYCIPIWRM